jgi:hypothetical protein
LACILGSAVHINLASVEGPLGCVTSYTVDGTMVGSCARGRDHMARIGTSEGRGIRLVLS